MRSSPRPIGSFLIATALAAGGTGLAHADSASKLAPAGSCAEPREALLGVAPSGLSSFSVVGPLQSFFSPADVAAAPAPPSRPTPMAPLVARPGACDQPGAGCAVPPVSRMASPPIAVPGTRPSRVQMKSGAGGGR